MMIFCYIEWDRNLCLMDILQPPVTPKPEPRRLHDRCPGPYPGLLTAEVVKGMADVSLVYQMLYIHVYMWWIYANHSESYMLAYMV